MDTRLEQAVRQKKAEVLRLAAKHGARNVRLFGSVARGESNATSDIDFLVELEQGRSLLDHVGLQQDLSDLFGRPVDVVLESGVSPHLAPAIFLEAVPL